MRGLNGNVSAKDIKGWGWNGEDAFGTLTHIFGTSKHKNDAQVIYDVIYKIATKVEGGFRNVYMW